MCAFWSGHWISCLAFCLTVHHRTALSTVPLCPPAPYCMHPLSVDSLYIGGHSWWFFPAILGRKTSGSHSHPCAASTAWGLRYRVWQDFFYRLTQGSVVLFLLALALEPSLGALASGQFFCLSSHSPFSSAGRFFQSPFGKRKLAQQNILPSFCPSPPLEIQLWNFIFIYLLIYYDLFISEREQARGKERES